MVDLMCAGPARVYGAVGKGRLAAGYDADFTLVDMKQHAAHRGKLDRFPLRLDAVCGDATSPGWPVATIVRGSRPSCARTRLLGAPRGKLVTHRPACTNP
jgi:dihydroorotase